MRLEKSQSDVRNINTARIQSCHAIRGFLSKMAMFDNALRLYIVVPIRLATFASVFYSHFCVHSSIQNIFDCIICLFGVETITQIYISHGFSRQGQGKSCLSTSICLIYSKERFIHWNRGGTNIFDGINGIIKCLILSKKESKHCC